MWLIVSNNAALRPPQSWAVWDLNFWGLTVDVLGARQAGRVESVPSLTTSSQHGEFFSAESLANPQKGNK